MNFTEKTATEAVLHSLAGTVDPRVKQLAEAMVLHLHAFVREVEPTMAEWEQAIGFLTAVGQASTETRQEFVLLSDVLGVSMLVESINARLAGENEQTTRKVTPSTILGPFHMVASPLRSLGDNLYPTALGEACLVTGRVTDLSGAAMTDAQVDVWQCDSSGFYDVQQPDVQPSGNGRGLFNVDDDGKFWFRTVVPSFYPVPLDGPVGDFLRATSRHAYRPAHIHFIVDGPGVMQLTTHIFVADSPYIDSDTVFAVNSDLVKKFNEIDDLARAERYGVCNPFRHVHAELVVRHNSAIDAG